jgi:hypothetical protein
MQTVLASAGAIILIVLFAVAFGPGLRAGVRSRRQRPRGSLRLGRRLSAEELAAEQRAEKLMADVVGSEGLEQYRALGFLHSFGDPEDDGSPGYGYLIYPHRPIVSFDARSGRLLNELCVSFPDQASDQGEERLPDADDVLAKWMAIRGDELGLLAAANIHAPGRQVDPAQSRRDVIRLREWTTSPADASASDGLAAAQ